MTTLAVSERDFEGAVLDALRVYGWRTAHFRPARTSRGWRTAVSGDGRGFPDIVAVRGDRFLAVELKAAKGRLSDEQAAWLEALAAAGAEACCWRPNAWDEIAAVLR